VIGKACGLFHHFSRDKGIDHQEIRRILIFRYGALGDIVMSTPVIEAVSEMFPEAEIDYVVDRPFKEVLQGNPHLDAIFDYLPIQSFAIPFREKVKFLSRLRKFAPDLSIILEGGPYTQISAYLAGSKYRAGLDSFNHGFLLTHKVPIYPYDQLHTIDKYFEMLSILGYRGNAAYQMRLYPAPEDFSSIEDFLQSYKIGPDDVLIALFPGGGENPQTVLHTKRWPKEYYAELAGRLITRYGAKIILIGGPDDYSLNEQVVSLIDYPVINIAGKMPILQTAAFLKRADLYIGNDSGPLYLAAAMGIPTISIFGPTNPARLAPIGEKHLVVKSDIDCSPCYREVLGSFPQCENPECMKSITVKRVFEVVEKQLSKRVVNL